MVLSMLLKTRSRLRVVTLASESVLAAGRQAAERQVVVKHSALVARGAQQRLRVGRVAGEFGDAAGGLTVGSGVNTSSDQAVRARPRFGGALELNGGLVLETATVP